MPQRALRESRDCAVSVLRRFRSCELGFAARWSPDSTRGPVDLAARRPPARTNAACHRRTRQALAQRRSLLPSRAADRPSRRSRRARPGPSPFAHPPVSRPACGLARYRRIRAVCILNVFTRRTWLHGAENLAAVRLSAYNEPVNSVPMLGLPGKARSCVRTVKPHSKSGAERECVSRAGRPTKRVHRSGGQPELLGVGTRRPSRTAGVLLAAALGMTSG